MPTSAYLKYTRDLLSKAHDGKYDYSKYVYTGSEKPSIFICPVHGEFEQTPYNHIRGFGCRMCGTEAASKKRFRSTKEFIEEAQVVHNDTYDYSKVKYVSAKKNITITCKIHGDFEQTPDSHLRGSGCSLCSRISSGLNRRGNTKNFIKKAKALHGDLFDYSEVEYIKNYIKVKIKCKNGHEFYQTPANHLSGYGCSYCQISPLHQFLHANLGGVLNDRTVLEGKEIDLYFPENRVAFEINGVYYHSADFLDRNYHQEKVDFAKTKDISLFHIWYDRDTNFELVLSWAKSKLHLIDKRIYARNTHVRKIGAKDYREFLEKTHLQGSTTSKVKYGLFHKNEIVSVMGFSFRSGDWYLDRFSSKLEHSVVGGFSKLLKSFVQENNPQKITTYSDFSYSDGTVYEKNGFIKERVSESPRLYYTNGVVLEDRRRFQRSKILSRRPDSVWGTEKEMAKGEGFVPLFGCKTVRWGWYP